MYGISVGQVDWFRFWLLSRIVGILKKVVFKFIFYILIYIKKNRCNGILKNRCSSTITFSHPNIQYEYFIMIQFWCFHLNKNLTSNYILGDPHKATWWWTHYTQIPTHSSSQLRKLQIYMVGVESSCSCMHLVRFVLIKHIISQYVPWYWPQFSIHISPKVCCLNIYINV